MKKRNILICTLFVISICILNINTINKVTIQEQNKELIQSYFEKKEIVKKEQYMGILEIPKIKLKRGFYNYNSPLNTVDNNIEIISSKCNPGKPCDFILASHSGNSDISFFKHLDNLMLGDLAILYFNNKKWNYTLEKKVSVIKNGTISLENKKEERLILTTCNRFDHTLQDIYYFTKKSLN